MFGRIIEACVTHHLFFRLQGSPCMQCITFFTTCVDDPQGRLNFEILSPTGYWDIVHTVCAPRPRLLALPLPVNPWRGRQLPGKGPCLVADLSGFVEGLCPKSRINFLLWGCAPFVESGWSSVHLACPSVCGWISFTRRLVVSRVSSSTFFLILEP